MRKASPLAPLALVMALGAATYETPPPRSCGGPARQTLIFYDQSASSVADRATAQLFQQTITAAASTGLQCHGDAVHAFQLHHGTRAKAGRVDVANEVPPVSLTGKTKIAQAIATADHDRQIQALQRTATQQLLAIVSTPVAPAYRHNTDILGSLEVINDVIAQSSPRPTVVYFLSDMRESMRGPGRRDFDSAPPTSPAQARAWADQDAALLRQMHVDPPRFRNVEVRVLLGSLALKPHTTDIRFYWERLLKNAGVNPANVHFG